MYAIRKIVSRRPWLMATVVIALLVQIQQTLACDMMIDVSAPASGHCYKHETTDDQSGKPAHPCCDFSAELSVNSSHCHDGHESVVNQPLPGKADINNIQPLILTINLEELFPSAGLTGLHHTPDSNSALPGTQTYLSTQRLRI